jgi:hypothetical protein
MRFIALLAVVVALVGGYVVGQELAPSRGNPLPEALRPIEDQTAQPGQEQVVAALRRKRAELLERRNYPVDHRMIRAIDEQIHLLEHVPPSSAPRETPAPPVGRYLPVGTDRLLDSATGTLYRMEGADWIETVTLRGKPTAKPTTGLDLDELLGTEPGK